MTRLAALFVAVLVSAGENDVLIVETVGFLPGVITAPVRHGDKLHVVEWFTLDPKTMRLTRDYTAEDPVYLKGKYSGSDVVQVADAPFTDDKCKEQGFIDYSKQAGRWKRETISPGSAGPIGGSA